MQHELSIALNRRSDLSARECAGREESGDTVSLCHQEWRVGQSALHQSSRLCSRPVPKRGTWGNDILGPQNPDRARQEPDIVLPPVTDAGKMPNMKW